LFFPSPLCFMPTILLFSYIVPTPPTPVLNLLLLLLVWTADPLPGLEPMYFAKYIHSLSQLTINTPYWTAAPGPATLKWPVATPAPYRCLPASALWPFYYLFTSKTPISSHLWNLPGTLDENRCLHLSRVPFLSPSKSPLKLVSINDCFCPSCAKLKSIYKRSQHHSVWPTTKSASIPDMDN